MLTSWLMITQTNSADGALSDPELYINRELSQLEFVGRVITQAQDERVPLLERLRFLCIACSVLDEFFEIRVARLKHQEAYGSVRRGPDNLSPQEQLRRIALAAAALVSQQYSVLKEVLLPQMALEGISVLRQGQWSAQQKSELKRFFDREIAPIVSPIGLDPSHPFPPPMNKGLAFMVTLRGQDAFGRNSGKAIIQTPRSLPKILRLSGPTAKNQFVLVASIIQAYVSELFPGMSVSGCYPFRVTRNSHLFLDEEEIVDLVMASESEKPARRYGDAVRLEVSADCPASLIHFLASKLGLSQDSVYRCDGPVDLAQLEMLADVIESPRLKYIGFSPAVPRSVRKHKSMFEAIREGEILLHHPYESFVPVVNFLRQAACDPQVLAIRQTLYRTGSESAVVEALVEAAARGKEVLVVIELRARFDEEANIELAGRLHAVGVQVVYGVVGHKTHAKMCMVTRREGDDMNRYVHLGTGNYHTRTTRRYTDYGFFSCDVALAADVQRIFQQLTAMGRVGKLQKILQAPLTLHADMLKYIHSEAKRARKNKPAAIYAKMNALVEPRVIRALYKASQAGVVIHLIVRGACALRPNVKGISDNITVTSVVGRFLEHTRVFCFENAGDPLVYLSSADWMGRNFFSRVEICFPIEDPALKARVFTETIEMALADNVQAWSMKADGSYIRKKAKKKPRSMQDLLLQRLRES